MGNSLVNIGPALYLALVVLVIIAAAVAASSGTRIWQQIPWAAVRATVQLLGLALLLTVIVDHWATIVAFITLMAWVAAWTSDGRVSSGIDRHDPRLLGRVNRHEDSASPAPVPSRRRERISRTAWTLLPVAAFAITMTTALVAVGVVPATGVAVIPVAGIFIGNGMNVTTLTGRRCQDELRDKLGQVEAAIALGFTEHRARLLILRETALTAFGPTIDSTRTVGLVTIPGAFVGMILGGASLVDAAVMQLFVMLGILAVAAVANAATMRLIAAGRM